MIGHRFTPEALADVQNAVRELSNDYHLALGVLDVAGQVAGNDPVQRLAKSLYDARRLLHALVTLGRHHPVELAELVRLVKVPGDPVPTEAAPHVIATPADAARLYGEAFDADGSLAKTLAAHPVAAVFEQRTTLTASIARWRELTPAHLETLRDLANARDADDASITEITLRAALAEAVAEIDRRDAMSRAQLSGSPVVPAGGFELRGFSPGPGGNWERIAHPADRPRTDVPDELVCLGCGGRVGRAGDDLCAACAEREGAAR